MESKEESPTVLCDRPLGLTPEQYQVVTSSTTKNAVVLAVPGAGNAMLIQQALQCLHLREMLVMNYNHD
jgi:hypothetical protein